MSLLETITKRSNLFWASLGTTAVMGLAVVNLMGLGLFGLPLAILATLSSAAVTMALMKKG